jgi:hypothetical protein
VGNGLFIALGASLVSAALLTLTYNAVYRSGPARRFRARRASTHLESPWDMEPEAPLDALSRPHAPIASSEPAASPGRHVAPTSVNATSYDSRPLVSP